MNDVSSIVWQHPQLLWRQQWSFLHSGLLHIVAVVRDAMQIPCGETRHMSLKAVPDCNCHGHGHQDQGNRQAPLYQKVRCKRQRLPQCTLHEALAPVKSLHKSAHADNLP